MGNGIVPIAEGWIHEFARETGERFGEQA
jgi:hypothetical protein